MDVDHHLMELCIDLFRRPDETLGVLAHFQSRDADAACVDSLGRSNDHVLLAHQIVQGVVRRGHVGDFDVILHAVGDDLLGRLHVDVVRMADGMITSALTPHGFSPGKNGTPNLSA